MDSLNATESTLDCRTLWISDVHLGSVNCRADYLLDLLRRVRCQRLYLVGDIVDLWAMHRRVYWPESHNRVLRKLMEMSRDGIEVIYIPGNHDQSFREFDGASFGRVSLKERAIHETLDGRRFLVTHGDELDYAVRCSRVARVLGDLSYDMLMWMNRCCNRYRSWLGKPYWSLAAWLKGHISQAAQAIDAFQDAGANLARQQGLDGIICGHLHHPVIRDYGDVLYCNDGDWVESCSALLEDHEGALHLIQGITSPQTSNTLLFAEQH